MPRYPVYVISKGRWGKEGLTARFLIADGVPFSLVVEPQEYAAYAAALTGAHIEVLPFSNLGKGSIPARNWVWEHARAAGHERHWILDDNIRMLRRWYKSKRVPCAAGVAFAAMEDFVDRYENVALAGPNYTMFAIEAGGIQPRQPFWLNCHVYSCFLIRNDLPYRWRGRYNEDTDLCLQALSGGWCTISFNAFTQDKRRTMTMKGGNTTELYQGDGRLRMARSLERMWPGVVETKRRFQRPQHVVKDSWRRFDTPLKLKEGIDRAALAAAPNEYGMRLTQVAPEVKSPRLRRLLAEANAQDQESDAAASASSAANSS